MTISRPGTALTGEIRVTPSNYYRHLQGPEETVISGREYVITKTALDMITFPTPKRGDRLSDAELGISVISEVRELFDLGGSLMGFRIRTS